jgi:hypothetical protein
VLGAVAALASAPPAWADDLGAPIEPSDEKVRLVYAAPAGCPDRTALLEGVRARIGSEWEAPEGELARQIDVRIEPRGGRFVGTIEFLDADGQRVTRSVGGEQCQNVVNGMALVTALAIESRVDEALDQSEPVAAPAAAAPPPVPSAPPSRPRPRPQPVTPADYGKFRFSFRGVGVTGVGPELALGAGFSAAQEWGWLRSGITIDVVRSSRVERNAIAVNYSLASARVEGGVGWWLSHAVGLDALVFLEGGSMSAETSLSQRVTVPGDGSAPFLAPGVAGRIVSLAEPVLISLEVTSRFPLVREEFGVDIPGDRPQLAYKVRPYSAGAALGAGVRF